MNLTKIFCITMILGTTINCLYQTTFGMGHPVSAKIPVFLTVTNETNKKYGIPRTDNIFAINPKQSKYIDITNRWNPEGSGLLLYIVELPDQKEKLKLLLANIISPVLSSPVLRIELLDPSNRKLLEEEFKYTPGSNLGVNVTITLKGEDLLNSTLDVVGVS